MLGAVRRNAEVQPVLARGRCKCAHNIAMRAHLHRIPRGNVRVVHRKAVTVLSHGNYVARAGTCKQVNPCVGIEVLGTELRNEVLVAELRLRSVHLNVMLELGASRDVHVAGIPLVSKCRDGVHTPMNEDAELCIPIPRGNAITGQRIPIRRKATVARPLIHADQLTAHAFRILLRTQLFRMREEKNNCGQGQQIARTKTKTTHRNKIPENNLFMYCNMVPW